MGGKGRPRMAPPDYRMCSPVRCLHCGAVYDMGAVQPVARYADCTVWRCPGCKLQVDDRCLYGWGGRRDVERVEQPDSYEMRHFDIRGSVRIDRVIYPGRNGLYPL